MYIIDHSQDNDFYTQRNNQYFGSAACNVTSGINFCKANKIPYRNPTKLADDDYLMTIARSKEAFEVMEKLASWAVKDWNYQVKDWSIFSTDWQKRYYHPPSEVWVMLEWSINKMCEMRVCKINWQLTKEDFFNELLNNAILCGGKYTSTGHFLTAVGFVSSVPPRTFVDYSKITHVIVDDTWGDLTTQYRSKKGNSIHIPINMFLKLTRDYDKSGVIWGFLKV